MSSFDDQYNTYSKIESEFEYTQFENHEYADDNYKDDNSAEELDNILDPEPNSNHSLEIG